MDGTLFQTCPDLADALVRANCAHLIEMENVA